LPNNDDDNTTIVLSATQKNTDSLRGIDGTSSSSSSSSSSYMYQEEWLTDYLLDVHITFSPRALANWSENTLTPLTMTTTTTMMMMMTLLLLLLLLLLLFVFVDTGCTNRRYACRNSIYAVLF
tara:strand:+ start:153 stop:521 length:369 start_codon:yes stop_codon:yes gene_type:complete